MKVSIILNKEELTYFELKDVISTLFSIPMRHPYSSADAMKENFFTSCDLVIEFCEIIRPDKTDPDSKKLKTVLTRMITKMNRLKEILSDYNDREKIEKFIYDVVLSFDGNGRLAGFMMASKHKDLIKKNPEIHSVSEIPAVKERFLKRKIYVNEEKADAQAIL